MDLKMSTQEYIEKETYDALREKEHAVTLNYLQADHERVLQRAEIARLVAGNVALREALEELLAVHPYNYALHNTCECQTCVLIRKVRAALEKSHEP